LKKDARRRLSREDIHSRSSGAKRWRIRNSVVLETFCPGMAQLRGLVREE
jgi:hypothetical protein